MWIVNDWHDWLLRLPSLLLCAVCIVVLKRRYSEHNYKGTPWTPKTRDLWFALVIWTVSGFAFSFEGMLENRPLEPRPIFYLLASTVTAIGVLRKGEWGGHDKKVV